MTTFDRRSFLKSAGALAATTAAAGAAATAAAGAAATALSPAAQAQQRRVLGTVIDYSAAVPSARAVKAAGHIGAVRYVSQPRPDALWMRGKPVTLDETQDYKANGLSVASVYQFGRADTADWLQGPLGAAKHAPQAIALHRAAGGPTGRPIYVAIDDNPTLAQFNKFINPYLSAMGAALSAAGYQLGVYGNYYTIAWCLEDGIGSYFWQHDWGSRGNIHPRANIHQVAGRQAYIQGIQVDINDVYTADWGQWTPGQSDSLFQMSSLLSSNGLLVR